MSRHRSRKTFGALRAAIASHARPMTLTFVQGELYLRTAHSFDSFSLLTRHEIAHLTALPLARSASASRVSPRFSKAYWRRE